MYCNIIILINNIVKENKIFINTIKAEQSSRKIMVSIGETFKRHPAAGRLKGTQVENAPIVSRERYVR